MEIVMKCMEINTDSVHQPIAMFASKGPVKGNTYFI